MIDDSMREHQEPEMTKREAIPTNMRNKGVLVSAMVQLPTNLDSSGTKIEFFDDLWVPLPDYNLHFFDLVEILDVVTDEDGHDLYLVKPVGMSFEDDSFQHAGKRFLAQLDQLEVPDQLDLYQYLLSQLLMLRNVAATRTDYEEGIDRLFHETGNGHELE